MNKVLLVEPEPSGHHFSLYARLFIRAFKGDSELHLLTSETSINHPALDILLVESNNKLTIHYVPAVKVLKTANSFYLLYKQAELFFKIRNGFKKMRFLGPFSEIIIINLDHIDKVLSIFGSPFGKNYYSGIFLNPKFHKSKIGISVKSRSDILYQILFSLILKQKYLKLIYTVDETFYSFIKSKKLKYLPEPYDCIKNKSGNISSDTIIFENVFPILVFGDISYRKGVKELLNAYLLIKTENIILYFVGVFSEDVKVLFEDITIKKLISKRKIIIQDGFQTDLQLFNAFSNSKLVWVGYTNGFSGSSGVYYQASYFGIPVISNNYGLLGYLVKKNMNGIVCDVNSPQSVATAITNLSNNILFYKQLSSNSLLVAEKHSPNNFINVIKYQSI